MCIKAYKSNISTNASFDWFRSTDICAHTGEQMLMSWRVRKSGATWVLRWDCGWSLVKLNWFMDQQQGDTGVVPKPDSCIEHRTWK